MGVERASYPHQPQWFHCVCQNTILSKRDRRTEHIEFGGAARAVRFRGAGESGVPGGNLPDHTPSTNEPGNPNPETPKIVSTAPPRNATRVRHGGEAGVRKAGAWA